MIAEHIQQAVTAPPKAGADFSCLGKVAYDGKDYLAYRTAPEKTEKGAELARTIYVDPATGLPAFNVIAEVERGRRAAAQGELHLPDRHRHRETLLRRCEVKCVRGLRPLPSS